MNYDNWKIDTPEEEKENKCMHCEKPVEKKDSYCSRDCFKADML